jgi:transcriptional regulator with XRE-family HTH domain
MYPLNDMPTLKELRLRANLSQKALADKVDVSTQHVSCWERGVYNPNTASVRKICRALRCKRYELEFSSHDLPANEDRIKELEKQVADGTTLLEKIVSHMDTQEEYIENLENIIKDAGLAGRLPP